MKQINLKAVYSRYAPHDSQESWIKNIRLSRHQVRTQQLLKDPNTDVIINTASTGDGKSLAAYISSLTANIPTLGLYPTNELGRDQEHQITHYVKHLSSTSFPQRVCRLDSEELTELSMKSNTSRREALVHKIETSEILLTNPDIHHLIMNGYYLRKVDNPDKIFDHLMKFFDLTVFDEFHLFGAPQIVSVVNAMLLARATQSSRRKYLFLSATPSKLLLEALDRANFKCEIVQGEYLYADMNEECNIDSNEYRRITNRISLSFNTVSTERKAEHWLLDNAENVIIKYFKDHPGSKCAVILNSVGAVKRCYKQLKPLLEGNGISVGENTGFSSRAEHADSHKKNVLIGTSTIDVGVDFKINLLIFEATDSGSFMQRLGRLGRHDGYINDKGETILFSNFVAYALVPKYIYEQLFEVTEKTGSTRLSENNSYDRENVYSIIRDIYPNTNEFSQYAKRWGGLQSLSLYLQLKNRYIESAYRDISERLRTDYENSFELNWKYLKSKYFSYLKGEYKEENKILETAKQFRGGTGLECAVIDKEANGLINQFKTYDLPGLLTNCVISEVLDKDEYLARADTSGISPNKFKYCKLFLIVERYRDYPAYWSFYRDDLTGLPIDRVRSVTGLSVINTDCNVENEINQRLMRMKLVQYIISTDAFNAKRRASLPQLFPLYSLRDHYTRSNHTTNHSIALGQEALLTETVLRNLKEKEKGWVI